MARLLVAVACGLLLLSGCGTTDDPKPSPTSSPTPTRTTPPVPVLPEAAKANTKAGAEAFVRHYVDLLNLAQATGNTAPVAASSLTTCETCQAVIDKLRQLRQEGATVVGGTWTIESLAVGRINAPSQAGLVYGVALGIRSTKQTITKPAGAPDIYPAGPANHHLTLVWRAQAWKVAAWSVR